MHERGRVEEAVNTLVALSRGRRVTEVEIVLGPGMLLSIAEPAWEELTAGTPAEGARVTWELARDTLRCMACDLEYPGDRLDACPMCGSDGMVVERVPEIAIGESHFEGGA